MASYEFTLLIYVKMSTAVGILALMSRINTSCVLKREKSIFQLFSLVTAVLLLFLAVPWVGLQKVIVVFPVHTHLHVLFMSK